MFLIMLLFNKYVFYELLYQQICHPPFICRLDVYPLYHMSNIDCVCHCRYEYIYLVTLKTSKVKNRKCLQKMYDSYNRPFCLLVRNDF